MSIAMTEIAVIASTSAVIAGSLGIELLCGLQVRWRAGPRGPPRFMRCCRC